MKAVTQMAYGGPEVMQVADLPEPEPGAGQIKVKNHCAVISGADLAFRTGKPFVARLFSGLFKPKHPVPGDVVCGEVVESGKDVSRFKVGDRIWGMSFGADANPGGLAEFVVADEAGAFELLPEAMSYAEAAALLDSGMTAISFLRDHSTMKSGVDILINGASAAIGTAAVQLARAWGARVTAVCSGPNVALVKRLGADEVIDYTQTPITSLSSRFDVIFDVVGKSSYSATRHLLKPEGKYLTTVPSWGILGHMLIANRFRKREAKLATTGLRPIPDKRKDMRDLAMMFGEGTLEVVIDSRYPMTQIQAAHRRLDTNRKVGSLIVDLQTAGAD